MKPRNIEFRRDSKSVSQRSIDSSYRNEVYVGKERVKFTETGVMSVRFIVVLELFAGVARYILSERADQARRNRRRTASKAMVVDDSTNSHEVHKIG